jgi:hypothetical protein
MRRHRGNRFATLSKGRVTERGKRNQTEAEYEALLKTDADVAAYWFEPFSLRLSNPGSGQPARYTPDFLVLLHDGTTYVDDVKGTGPDDPAAIIRIKTAAELFPLWMFRIAKKRTKRDGGGFDLREV